MTKRLSWILAIYLGILDIIRRYVGATFEPKYFAGITRYYSPNLVPPFPIITIAVTIFMVLIGIGTLIAFLGNGLSTDNFGTLPASCSEFVMILSLLVTERYVSLAPESFFAVGSGDLITDKA